MLKKFYVVLALMVGLAGCTQTPAEDLTRTTYALGTVISINLYDQGDEALMDSLVKRVGEIESIMSAQIETSEINQVTSMAGIEPVQVSEETFQVVKRALYYADLSGGKFDPTIGPVVDLWGIGTDDARVPDQSEIDLALDLVDYNKVILDESALTVYLQLEGMSLDLGGIAKGYVADQLALYLEGTDVERAMINLGGNIYAYGQKEDGSPYKIAVQTPYDIRNTYFGYAEVKDGTVVTSGPYERYFEVDGQIYHHIFDASTGYPTSGDTVSVSIIGDSSMDADALSTLLFTMPPEDGLEFIEDIDGVECIYVDEAYGLTLSSGLASSFTVTDESYIISP